MKTDIFFIDDFINVSRRKYKYCSSRMPTKKKHDVLPTRTDLSHPCGVDNQWRKMAGKQGSQRAHFPAGMKNNRFHLSERGVYMKGRGWRLVTSQLSDGMLPHTPFYELFNDFKRRSFSTILIGLRVQHSTLLHYFGVFCVVEGATPLAKGQTNASENARKLKRV